jgi:hypothetical protein
MIKNNSILNVIVIISLFVIIYLFQTTSFKSIEKYFDSPVYDRLNMPTDETFDLKKSYKKIVFKWPTNIKELSLNSNEIYLEANDVVPVLKDGRWKVIFIADPGMDDSLIDTDDYINELSRLTRDLVTDDVGGPIFYYVRFANMQNEKTFFPTANVSYNYYYKSTQDGYLDLLRWINVDILGADKAIITKVPLVLLLDGDSVVREIFSVNFARINDYISKVKGLPIEGYKDYTSPVGKVSVISALCKYVECTYDKSIDSKFDNGGKGIGSGFIGPSRREKTMDSLQYVFDELNVLQSDITKGISEASIKDEAGAKQ